MGRLLDTRAEGLWLAVQEAEGTAASAAQKRLRKTGGDINLALADGTGQYSDGQRFGDAQDYRDTQTAEGSPAAQMQAGPTALLAAGFLGDEEVTESDTGSGLYDHVATEGEGSVPLTAWKRVGDAVGPLRQLFDDCFISSLRLEASSANKIGVITPQIMSIGDSAGEIFDTDPVQDFDDEDALLHTEGEGRYELDGEVYRGTSQWAVVLNDALSTRYGDSVVPVDIAFALATIALEGVTIGLDEQGLERYFEQVYGMAEPPAGTKPLRTLPGLGSFAVDLRKGSQQRVALTGAPDGGTFTLSIGSRETGAIAYNATAGDLQTALEAIVGRDRVTCTGSALPTGPIKVVFRDQQPAMTGDNAELTGGTTPDVDITDDGYYRGLKVEIPGVKWNPDLVIAGNVEGGVSEQALGAQVRKVPGQEFITITTRNGDSTSYLAA